MGEFFFFLWIELNLCITHNAEQTHKNGMRQYNIQSAKDSLRQLRRQSELEWESIAVSIIAKQIMLYYYC